MNFPVTDAEVAAFKREWAKADAEGDAGNRVRRGLEAAAKARVEVEDQLLHRIADAWNNEGPSPETHRYIRARFEREWPTMVRAIQTVVHYMTVNNRVRNKK